MIAFYMYVSLFFYYLILTEHNRALLCGIFLYASEHVNKNYMEV